MVKLTDKEREDVLALVDGKYDTAYWLWRQSDNPIIAGDCKEVALHWQSISTKVRKMIEENDG